LCNGDHLHAELGGALGQGTQHAFPTTQARLSRNRCPKSLILLGRTKAPTQLDAS